MSRIDTTTSPVRAGEHRTHPPFHRYGGCVAVMDTPEWFPLLREVNEPDAELVTKVLNALYALDMEDPC